MMSQVEYESYLREQGFSGDLSGFYSNYLQNYDPVAAEAEMTSAELAIYMGAGQVVDEISNVTVLSVANRAEQANPELLGLDVKEQFLYSSAGVVDGISLLDDFGMLSAVEAMSPETLLAMMGGGHLALVTGLAMGLSPMVIALIALVAAFLIGWAIKDLTTRRLAVYLGERMVGVIAGELVQRMATGYAKLRGY